MLNYIKSDVIFFYSFLISEDKYQIIYYKFIDYKNISTNDYFGDFESNKYIHRVISTSDELELFLMKNDIYLEFMKIQKKKNKIGANQFFITKFFFYIYK
jgi:hypothetical protein